MTHRVTGNGLLSLVRDYEGEPKSRTVTAAGYLRPNGKPSYTAFYEALLEAKGIEPPPVIPRGCADGPAIYVACLASYNAGKLYGSWLDLSAGYSADEIRDAIQSVIRESPEPFAEEYAIHDSQYLPGFLARSEWPDIDQLATYSQVCAELSEDEERAYRHLCDDAGAVLQLSEFRERFRGWYSKPEGFAYDLYEEAAEIPEFWRRHINWSSIWEELDSGGDYSAIYDTTSHQYLIAATC